MSTRPPGDGDPPRDSTIVRPRGAEPAGRPPAPSANVGTPIPAAAAGSPAAISEFFAGFSNPLVQSASPLLLLATQLRSTVSQPDVALLRTQVVAQIRQFETSAQAAGVIAQTVTAARYVLCTVLDEFVLNTPWGEQSGWAAKTLLVAFHSETYGGEKFFLILDRLCSDFSRHLDLIELMYVCLALGFGGRYQIETGGRARVDEIQEDLYRRIRGQRGLPAEELAPHWRGIEDRRNPLVRHIPLWVIVAAGACLLLAVFLYFYSQLNVLSSPLSAQLAQIGLEGASPPDQVHAAPSAGRKTLKQLLAPEEQAGALSVIEGPNGHERVQINASGIFASGGVEVDSNQVQLLHKITQALNQVPGHAVIVGHTDDQPVRSLRFKDNFGLSAARAHTVQEILSQGLDNPGRLESSGAGSSQPIAVPPDRPENRARNRRVEILFTPED